MLVSKFKNMYGEGFIVGVFFPKIKKKFEKKKKGKREIIF